MVRYDKNVVFGIMACRPTLPQIQRLIDNMELGLAELEKAAAITTSVVATKSTIKKLAAKKKSVK